MNLTLRDAMDDWYVIEREHGGRICGADIEGTAEEMLAIADAIECGESFASKRCAVSRPVDGAVEMHSPRNSIKPARVTLTAAKALAVEIRRVIAERSES